MQKRIDQGSGSKSRKDHTPKVAQHTFTRSGGFHKTCSQLPTTAEKPRPTSTQNKAAQKSPICKNSSTKPVAQTTTPALSKPLPKSGAPSTNAKTATKASVNTPAKVLSPKETPFSLPKASNPSAIAKAKTASLNTPTKASPTCPTPSSTKALPKTGITTSTPVKASLSPSHSRRKSPASPPSLIESSKSGVKPLPKFDVISASILKISDAKKPVKTKSLEDLLSQGISKSLGEKVNDPAIAQRFEEATRTLLEELVELYEGGQLPNLSLAREKQSYLRANSATTVCYRDRYFKELVMNVLQSMTSSDIQEEVTGQAARSEESAERIRVIRDMVRAEAGIEPDSFRELEQKLEDFRREITRNKLDVKNAALEVDKTISQQKLDRERQCTLQIPRPAREVLKSNFKRLESGSDAAGTCEGGHNCQKLDLDKAEHGKEKYKNSLKVIGEDAYFENGSSDEVNTIRPQLKNLVHEELLKTKMKEEETSNEGRDLEIVIELGKSPKSSLESVEYKSASSNQGEEDENDSGGEEKHNFLETLRAELEENHLMNDEVLNCRPPGCYITVMERIDEVENEMIYDDLHLNKTKSLAEHTSSNNLINNNLDIHESSKALLPSLIDIKETYVEKQNVTNNNLDVHDASEQLFELSLEKQNSEQNLIERVRSNLLFREALDIHNVVTEIKNAFQAITDYCVSAEENCSEKIETDNLNTTETNEDDLIYLWDFSVEEISTILLNISVKINGLPERLEITLNKPSEQELQVLDSLSVLEKCMKFSNTAERSAETVTSIKDYAKVFYSLSDSLKCSSVKSESISSLSPPKSLIETLYALSSTAYFKDCFKLVKQIKPERLYENKLVEPCHTSTNTSQNHENIKNVIDYLSTEKKADWYINQSHSLQTGSFYKVGRSKKDNVMGFAAPSMTVQDVSDMFLYLASVLNDYPERLKSKTVLELQPPYSFLKAVDILYHEDTGPITDNKKESFASLTIQNVTDYLLYLSKTFDDIPERLKGSLVTDLNPPESLTQSLAMLNSLSHFSIHESLDDQEVEEEEI